MSHRLTKRPCSSLCRVFCMSCLVVANALESGDDLDLDQTASRKGGNLEGAARGERGLKLGGVDLVHGGEVGNVGQVDRGLDDIGKGSAGSGQQGLDVGEGLLGLTSPSSRPRRPRASCRSRDRCPAGRTGTPCCRPGCRGNTDRWLRVRYRKTRRSCSCFSPYDQIESVSAAFTPGGTIRSEHRA